MTDAQVPEIDVHQLRELLSGDAALVDVREPDEWLGARVPGVPLIPMAEITERLDELPGGREIYVICASGRRSHRVVEYLRAQGIEAVNVAGGTNGWIEAGYEVESGPSTA